MVLMILVSCIVVFCFGLSSILYHPTDIQNITHSWLFLVLCSCFIFMNISSYFSWLLNSGDILLIHAGLVVINTPLLIHQVVISHLRLGVILLWHNFRFDIICHHQNDYQGVNSNAFRLLHWHCTCNFRLCWYGYIFTYNNRLRLQ